MQKLQVLPVATSARLAKNDPSKDADERGKQVNDLLRFVELVALRAVAMSENAAELYGEEESGPEPVLESKFKKRHYNRTLKFWGAVQRYISERAATYGDSAECNFLLDNLD
jgi:hypothetical protein